MKKYFLVLILIFSLFSSIAKKPNVVLIVVDDLGWTDLGYSGSDFYLTPNIDKLATEGMVFTNGYASCTVCSPSRAAIMSGKYPATLNCTDWISGHKMPWAKLAIPKWTQHLDENEITLAESLKADNYNTVHLGKWHLGEEEKYWPENQGFDVNIGGYKQGSPQNDEGGSYFSPYFNPRLSDGPKNEYLTERLANEAIKYFEIHKSDDKPFFMNLWFYSVHRPLQAKEDKIEKYRALRDTTKRHHNPVYAAMVEHVDDAVGKLLNMLEESGLEKETIILFTSDNGGLIGNRNKISKQVTSNYPLRSGKGDCYEGGVRVPFIIKWPEKIAAGTIDETPVTSIDIYPTVLGLTGSPMKPASEIDGIDFSKLMVQGQKITREAIYWHYPHYHLQGATPYSAIRKGDWKLIEFFETGEVELYNLHDNIEEDLNLALSHPEKVKELMNDLVRWRKKAGAQLPTVNTSYDETRARKRIK
ncbi:sulfatase [Maribellus maritimus]|uniref:sulfatase n=1 Tax=Maribellus maritimus TaxID=2870838 RepID=UPI001EE9BD53|nr:sulfatase [Maribellus maritimus]MCG6188617.1 sulfatase [Maribellus maritimus]